MDFEQYSRDKALQERVAPLWRAELEMWVRGEAPAPSVSISNDPLLPIQLFHVTGLPRALGEGFDWYSLIEMFPVRELEAGGAVALHYVAIAKHAEFRLRHINSCMSLYTRDNPGSSDWAFTAHHHARLTTKEFRHIRPKLRRPSLSARHESFT